MKKQYGLIKGMTNEVTLYRPDVKMKTKAKDVEQCGRRKKHSSKTSTNVSSTEVVKYVSCPTWGGSLIRDGKLTTLLNTCPIDNFIFIYCNYLVSHPLSSRRAICKTLTRLTNLAARSRWNEAKFVWIDEVLKLKPDMSSNIDPFGSEYEFFVKYLGEIKCFETNGLCRNNDCLHCEERYSSAAEFGGSYISHS